MKIKVGIFGLANEDTPVLTDARNVENLIFLPAIGVAENYVRFLREVENATVVIALTHIGAAQDNELARSVRGIDVIVGGHDHLRFTVPVRIDNTPIVQAGSAAAWLGDLRLFFKDNVIDSFTYVSRPTHALPMHPEVVRIVRTYEDIVRPIFGVTIGETLVDLDGRHPVPPAIRGRETNLGNLIADAFLWGLRKDHPDVEIVVQNGGGIRWHHIFRAGPITLGDAYALLPFTNWMVIMDLKGSDILRALERSVSASPWPAGWGGWLHVAGLRFAFDNARPLWSRVTAAWVNGVPLDPARTYRVGMNSFLAVGGDGYAMFKENGENRIETGILYADPFVEYLKAFSPVSPVIDGRIMVAENAHVENVPVGIVTIDARAATDAVVIINTTEKGWVSAIKYRIHPAINYGEPENTKARIPPAGTKALGKWVKVFTSIPREDIIWPIEVKVYYSDDDVAAAGIIEKSLRLSVWDSMLMVWMPVKSIVDNADNYVEARVYGLSTFGIFGAAEWIPAVIDVKPDTLNLKSKGKWTTCYIELPLGYDVADIDTGSVKLGFREYEIFAEVWPTEIGDYDKDGIPDLMVKFSRSAVQAMVNPGKVELTITGWVKNAFFMGSDVIKVTW